MTLLAESESLDLFVRSAIVKDPSQSVTKEELMEAYANFCADKAWEPVPLPIQRTRFPDLMLRHFSCSESHSVQRPQPQHRTTESTERISRCHPLRFANMVKSYPKIALTLGFGTVGTLFSNSYAYGKRKSRQYPLCSREESENPVPNVRTRSPNIDPPHIYRARMV